MRGPEKIRLVDLVEFQLFRAQLQLSTSNSRPDSSLPCSIEVGNLQSDCCRHRRQSRASARNRVASITAASLATMPTIAFDHRRQSRDSAHNCIASITAASLATASITAASLATVRQLSDSAHSSIVPHIGEST